MRFGFNCLGLATAPDLGASVRLLGEAVVGPMAGNVAR